MQKQKGLKRIALASVHSMSGFKAAILNEAAFRQEFFVFMALSFITFLLPISVIEQSLMMASLTFVLIVELLNSAIECLSDLITKEWDPLIKRAKDYGSLAVLLSLLIATLIWLVILLPESGLWT